MRKLFLQGLIFTAICVAVCLVLGFAMWTKQAQPADTAKFAYPIQSMSLEEEFVANEIRAAEKWRGRRLKISGKITDFGTDILGRPYVLLGQVQLLFSDSATHQITRYSVGDQFTAVCDFRGKGLGLILVDCSD